MNEPAARLEAVERRLKHLNGLFEDSRRADCERQDAARALEEGVTQVADQIRRGEARAELQALQVREGLWALRRRVDRMEVVATSTRAEAVPSPVVPDDAMGRLAERLDAMEAGVVGARSPPSAGFEQLLHRIEEGQQHTLSTLATLGEALAGLEQLVRLSSAPTPTPPTARTCGRTMDASSLAPINGLVEAPAAAANDASLDAIEAAMRELAEQVVVAEQRSSRTVNLMGHEIVRVAQHLDGRVEEVERRSGARALELGDELGRLSRVVEERLERADHSQTDALRTIGGQIATIATQLLDRITASELTSAAMTARGLAGVTEQVQRTSDRLQHRFESDAQQYAAKLRKTELQLDRLSAEVVSQAEAVDLAPLVLGEVEQRKAPSVAATPMLSVPVQHDPATSPRSQQVGPKLTAARQEPASSSSPFERTRTTALDRIRAAERAERSEAGPSLRRSTSDAVKGADAPVPPASATVPVVVITPPCANPTRELIDTARAAARSAAETSSRGARFATTFNLETRGDTSPGAPRLLRAGLSLLRERAAR